MNVHLCGKPSLDKVCREYGVPRLHINNLFGWSLIVALWPSGKVQDRRRAYRWVSLRRVLQNTKTEEQKEEDEKDLGIAVEWWT